ncbi:MAG: hypothetical protein SP1CHLAM54_11150 [Chlamydiia bacterium]|nr:hypothetical protein [Chlamydiia bacterium]MCH9616018.1 hypothetical protein [Chlamydiia bacterium]MCH9629041.1 hypothetical protein [Chlamydiia bacterium]
MAQIKEGSVKELWRIAYPLMISYFSLSMMLFVDRLYLARFSHEALNASTSSGTLTWALYLSWIAIASMAQVFVAQYNGAKRFSKVGSPVWQMIYFSLLSLLFFFPLAFIGLKFLGHLEGIYFKWTMLFSPSFIMVAALSAFYIGQGKTRVITYLALLGNGINIILDPILIYGFGSIIPSYGIAGAAVATGIGEVVQVVILFVMFISRANRLEYGTGDYRFKMETFLKVIKIGLPSGLFIAFEHLGLAAFYLMMARISPTHILVASVSQSILLLFLFFGYGLEKGVTAISGNLIGGKLTHEISRLFKSGLKLTALFSIVLLLTLVVYPEPFLKIFKIESSGEVTHLIRLGMIFTAAFMTLENLRWLISGILTSAGDTLFLMISGTLSVWLCMMLPMYFIVYQRSASIIIAFYIWIVYLFVALLLCLGRFLQGKWKEKSLIQDDETPQSEVISGPDGGRWEHSLQESDQPDRRV